MLRKLTNTLIFCFVISISFAQDYYWVGGSGNWSDINHWATTSGGTTIHAVVPGPDNNVIFDANSGFTTGDNTVTLDVSANCHDMTWVGAQATPVITGGATNPLNVYGSMTLQSGMNYAITTTNFLSDSAGETITTNGTTFGSGATSVTFNGDGSWDLQDDFTVGTGSGGNSGLVTLTKGTLRTNGNEVSISRFASTGTALRNLDISNSTIYSRSTGTGAGWSYVGSNHTLIAGNSNIYIAASANGSGHGPFSGDSNHQYHNIWFTYTAGNLVRLTGPIYADTVHFAGVIGRITGNNTIGVVTFTGAGVIQNNNTIGVATFTGTGMLNTGQTIGTLTFLDNGTMHGSSTIDSLLLAPGMKYTFQAGQTQTINTHLEASNPACAGLIELRSSSTSNQATLSVQGTYTISNALIEGINATGNIPITATSSPDLGNNSNILFPATTGNTLYWVGGSGDWNDENHWSTVNDGVYPPVSGGCVPTPLDDVVFNNNSGFSTGNNTVTLTGVGHHCRDMTWIGAQATPVITGGETNPLNVYGSMTLQSGMNYAITTTNFLSDSAGETITTNGTTFGSSGATSVTFNGDGSWDLQDDFTVGTGSWGNGLLTLTKGTLRTNGNEVSILRFASTGTALRNLDISNSTIYSRRTGAAAGWSYIGSNHTLIAGNSNIYIASYGGDPFSGDSNHQYHNIWFTYNTGTYDVRLLGPIYADTVHFAGGNGRIAGNNTIGVATFTGAGVIQNSNTIGTLTFLDNGTMHWSSTMDTLILSAGKNYKFQNGQTQTINHRLYASGNPCFVPFLSSTTFGSPAFLNVLGGSLDFNYTNVRDIDASGSYGTLEMGPQSTDAGNNFNINFAPYDPDAEIEGFGDHLDLPCPLTPFTIYTDGFYPNPSTLFEWGDGSTADSLHITSFGTYTISVDYGEDGEGCVVRDTLHVRPFDITPPVISNCPTDIVVSNDAGSCEAVVTWIEPIATDECMLDSLVSNFSPGDIFPIGTTTVTYTAYDANLNTATCSFEVTVNDTESPVFLYCPTDITVNNDLGSCETVVTWTPPKFTDNCTGVILTSTHNPGDIFPIGTTTVTYTATDGSGNTATCSFEVTVNDTESPVFLYCPTDITVNNDHGSCEAVVTWTPPTFTDNCTGVILTSTHEPGDVFPVGTTTVTYTATDGEGNTATCSFEVTVNDTESPVIVDCPTDITVNNDLGSCDAVVSWTAPTYTDNCTGTILTSTHNPGDIFPIGTTTVTYTATDGSGNTVTCSFEVTVNDTESPVFLYCPTDITVNNDLGSCDAVVSWTAPTFTDNCTGTTLTSTHEPGDVFPIGTTTVTYTATDGEGNTATCSFEVTVNDTENPVIVDCPTDITVNNDLGSCDAVVTWTAPTFTDNCTGTTLTSTHEPGDIFPIGTTTVTYTAYDANLNTATCSFEVTVNDTEAPVFVDFPSDTIVVCYGEVVDLSGIVVEDNCSGVTLTSTHEPGDVFPIGTTTVTYTATDASGNQTDTSLVVVVNDFPAIEVVNISENNCLGDNISLEALFDSDLGSVDWYFGQTYLGSDATLFIEKTGTFDNGIYTAVITDNNGCVASDSIHIHLVLCEIVVSEVITPNGDGLNDYLVIEQLEAYPNTSIWIYNRWGAEVYHSDDYQNDWDGRSESRFNVGGDKLPESTYYYLIELGGPSDSETYGKIYKGYFYLKHE